MGSATRGPGSDGAQVLPDGPPPPPRSALRMFCSTVLVLEAFVVFFAALAAFGLRSAPTARIVIVGLVAAVLCVAAAGLLRSVVGYVLGTSIQVALVLSGALLSDLRIHLLPLAIVFAVVWAIAWQQGRRIDAERGERYVAEIAHWRASQGPAGPADQGDQDDPAGAPGSPR